VSTVTERQEIRLSYWPMGKQVRDGEKQSPAQVSRAGTLSLWQSPSLHGKLLFFPPTGAVSHPLKPQNQRRVRRNQKGEVALTMNVSEHKQKIERSAHSQWTRREDGGLKGPGWMEN